MCPTCPLFVFDTQPLAKPSTRIPRLGGRYDNDYYRRESIGITTFGSRGRSTYPTPHPPVEGLAASRDSPIRVRVMRRDQFKATYNTVNELAGPAEKAPRRKFVFG